MPKRTGNQNALSQSSPFPLPLFPPFVSVWRTLKILWKALLVVPFEFWVSNKRKANKLTGELTDGWIEEEWGDWNWLEQQDVIKYCWQMAGQRGTHKAQTLINYLIQNPMHAISLMEENVIFGQNFWPNFYSLQFSHVFMPQFL